MKTRVRVRYAETDAQGIAYHSNHLVWFEVARTELFRHCVGESPGEFFLAYGMPLIEAVVRYHTPCRYDDELQISVEASQVRSRGLRFDYTIRRGADLVSEGYTVHVCVDGSGAPCRIPVEVREALTRGGEDGDGCE